MAAELGDQRDHAGADARDELIRFLALVVVHQHPARATGDIGHVRAPLLQDQIQAGAQPIPALLEGGDARAGAGDFEGDGGGRKCFLRLADP